MCNLAICWIKLSTPKCKHPTTKNPLLSCPKSIGTNQNTPSYCHYLSLNFVHCPSQAASRVLILPEPHANLGHSWCTRRNRMSLLLSLFSIVLSVYSCAFFEMLLIFSRVSPVGKREPPWSLLCHIHSYVPYFLKSSSLWYRNSIWWLLIFLIGSVFLLAIGFPIQGNEIIKALDWFTWISTSNQQVPPTWYALLQITMYFVGCLLLVHVKVNSTCIIHKQNCSKIFFCPWYWIHKLCSVSFPVICTKNHTCYDYPPWWRWSIAMTQSLKLNFNFAPSELLQISRCCTQKVFDLFKCN